ncbi:MAG: hypothetical protein H6739_30415 [Alphaproteobacteria bacterium]|nr:hypothetical protein [Alphaproteobacteria bacterium]
MLLLLLACSGDAEAPPTPLDRGQNAAWMRRQWIHGGPEVAGHEAALRQALAENARALGITAVYPFLGPMDADGHPGWRGDRGVIQRYDPATAEAFFRDMERLAPELAVIPWTGGNWRQDVVFGDTPRLAGFAAHAAAITRLGADGVQLNVEPLPSWTPGYLALLADVKAAIGPDKVLSVAAYPPPTPLHPFPDVHWELPFLAEVCRVADDLAVMGYDTGITLRWRYRGLMEDWTRALAETLPPPEAGGCTWRMGLPAYEDDEPWHHPDVETVDEAIRGVRAGLGPEPPSNFLGVAVYASWTTDADEWAAYEQLWRARAPSGAALPDRELPAP